MIMTMVLVSSLSMCSMTMTGCSGLPILSQPVSTSPHNRPPVPTDPNLVMLQMMQQQSLNKAMKTWAQTNTQQNTLQAQINEQSQQIKALLVGMSIKKQRRSVQHNTSEQCRVQQVDALFTGYDTSFQLE
jgi:hypothetical protein